MRELAIFVARPSYLKRSRYIFLKCLKDKDWFLYLPKISDRFSKNGVPDDLKQLGLITILPIDI